MRTELYSYDLIDFNQDVKDFNVIAGKDQDVDHIDLCKQFHLITEELKETADGLSANNPVEVLDGVVDVLVTALGLMHKLEVLGFDSRKALYKTAKNNLSKYTKSEEVAIESAKNLEAQGEVINVTYNSAYDVFVIKDVNDKVRKPLDFKSNSLEECIPMFILSNGFEGFPNAS